MIGELLGLFGSAAGAAVSAASQAGVLATGRELTQRGQEESPSPEGFSAEPRSKWNTFARQHDPYTQTARQELIDVLKKRLAGVTRDSEGPTKYDDLSIPLSLEYQKVLQGLKRKAPAEGDVQDAEGDVQDADVEGGLAVLVACDNILRTKTAEGVEPAEQLKADFKLLVYSISQSPEHNIRQFAENLLNNLKGNAAGLEELGIKVTGEVTAESVTKALNEMLPASVQATAEGGPEPSSPSPSP